MTDLSDGLADAVAAAEKSVLRVEGRRRIPATGIAWSEDGFVITANHVVRRDGTARVGQADGTVIEASLVGRDPTTDLAVLRAEGAELRAASWVDTQALRVGQLVLALGRPGHSVQATLGVVSALGGEWRTAAGGRVDRYLQTDVLMYPGFSGGALVDAAGGVAGLNTSALLRGVSVTVPTATVKRVASALIAHGRVRRGHLGVSVQPARLPERLADELGQDTGVLIAGVDAGSPAEAGGLVLGDVVVAANGSSLSQPDDLLSFTAGDRVGTELNLRVLRGGVLTDVSVSVGEQPA